MIHELTERQKEIYEFYQKNGAEEAMKEYGISKNAVYYIVYKKTRYERQFVQPEGFIKVDLKHGDVEKAGPGSGHDLISMTIVNVNIIL